MYDLDNFKIDELVQRHKDSEFTFEYNCDMSRIYPWGDKADTKRPISEFGVIWVEVTPGTEVVAHEHDEEESFLVISGKAELEVEGQSTVLETRAFCLGLSNMPPPYHCAHDGRLLAGLADAD